MFTFNIIGIVPVLKFFNYQQQQAENYYSSGITYLSSNRCSLDAVLRAVDYAEYDPTWKTDELTQTIINFWLSNLDSVTHWQHRLKTADEQTILVSRIAQTQALRHQLEDLFHE